MFEVIGHTKEAREQMRKYYVGVLQKNDHVGTPPQTSRRGGTSICSDLPKRVLQIVYIYVFTFCLHKKGMAERKSQETDVQLVFRRQTRDLKDVQDVLKSVMESSGQ